MTVASVIIFLAGESKDLAEHFRDDFPAKSWIAAIAIFVFGLALCGKEVIESVLHVAREIRRQASPGSSSNGGSN